MKRDPQTEAAGELSFSRFVPGACNRLAYEASVATAEACPKAAFPMLYLYGAPGVGKSHLLHAIARRVMERRPGGDVLLWSSEMFMSNLLAAMRERDIGRFRSVVGRADILLIEHVELFAGKEATQEELVRAVDLLQRQGRPVVISSLRAPGDLHCLEERLRSRLFSGLCAGIEPPDPATAVGVIEGMCRDACVTFPEEVVSYLAGIGYPDLRQLQGSVTKLFACQRLLRSPLTMGNVQRWLSDLLPSSMRSSAGDVMPVDEEPRP
jgi:ATPase involved in DNA replication initiation